jgi:hypothetical protein
MQLKGGKGGAKPNCTYFQARCTSLHSILTADYPFTLSSYGGCQCGRGRKKHRPWSQLEMDLKLAPATNGLGVLGWVITSPNLSFLV